MRDSKGETALSYAVWNAYKHDSMADIKILTVACIRAGLPQVVRHAAERLCAIAGENLRPKSRTKLRFDTIMGYLEDPFSFEHEHWGNHANKLLHKFAMKGDNKSIQMLLEIDRQWESPPGIDLNHVQAISNRSPHLSPYLVAAVHGHHDTARFILNCKADPRVCTKASYNKNGHMIVWHPLDDIGRDKNLTTEMLDTLAVAGFPAQHWMSRKGQFMMDCALSFGCSLPVVKWLIKHGVKLRDDVQVTRSDVLQYLVKEIKWDATTVLRQGRCSILTLKPLSS
jgi:hypothetical protein